MKTNKIPQTGLLSKADPTPNGSIAGTNPQAGLCPRCHAANLFMATVCIGCRAPLTPTVAHPSRRRGQLLRWGSALMIGTLGISALAYRYSHSSDAISSNAVVSDVIITPPVMSNRAPVTRPSRPDRNAAPPNVAPSSLKPPRGASSKGEMAQSPRRYIYLDPRAEERAPVERSHRRRREMNRRRSVSIPNVPTADAPADEAPAPVRAAPRGNASSGLVDQDVSNLANAIREASTREELNALEQFVDDLQASYMAQGQGGATVAVNWLKVAIRQKRNGPNPAGVTSWSYSLIRAESLAQEAARQSRMTPAEQAREQEISSQRIMDYTNAMSRNAASRRMN